MAKISACLYIFILTVTSASVLIGRVKTQVTSNTMIPNEQHSRRKTKNPAATPTRNLLVGSQQLKVVRELCFKPNTTLARS